MQKRIYLRWLININKQRVETLYRTYRNGYVNKPRPSGDQTVAELEESGIVGFYEPVHNIPEGYCIKPRQTLRLAPGGLFEAELETLEDAKKRASLAMQNWLRSNGNGGRIR